MESLGFKFTYFRQSIWKYLVQGFSSVLVERVAGLVTAVILARSSSVDIYGHIVLVYTVLGLLFAMSDFALTPALTIELSKDFEKGEPLFFSVINLRTLISYVILLGGLMYSAYTGFSIHYEILLCITLSESFNSLTRTCQSYLIATSQYNLILKIGGIVRTVQIALVGAMYYFQLNYLVVLITILIANFCIYRFSIRLIPHMKSRGKINALAAFKGIISKYKYLALNQVFAKLYDKIDAILISSYMTAANLGVYSVGYAFFSNYGVVSNAISAVYLPHYSKGSASHDKNQLKTILLEGLFVTTAIGGIVSGILFILAPLLISTFFGDRYLGAVVVAKIVSLGGILMLLSHNCGNFVNSIEGAKITLFAAITAFVFNICANIYFIPRYGIVSAAVITICTELLNVVILLAYIIYFFRGSNEDLSYR